MLAVVGGIAVTLGAAFFLSLAFSRGWITEPMRVLIGLGAGIVAIALGELAFLKVKGILGHVLLAVGLAIVSLSLFAATRLFGLVPAEVGVAGALLSAVVAAAIAIRHDSELVAAFGLVSVLAAPPLMGAEPTAVTVMFIAATLIGTTIISLFRTWVWLPPLAFLLAVPQVAAGIVGPPVPVGLAGIAAFWLINAIAAGGEEILRPSDRLRPTTATLLLANAAFTLWAGTALLDGSVYAAWTGSFVAAVAIAHLALGLPLLARHGDRHPFGMLVCATGVAAVTMAVPIQFGASWVPVAWAAEAVALTWVATRRRHPFAAATALVLGSMSFLNLVLIGYPPADLSTGFARDVPFVGAEGLTFAFLLAALVGAIAIVPVRWIRVLLAIVGIATTSYVLPFELSGAALVAAWSALSAVCMAGWVGPVSRRPAWIYAERHARALGLAAWTKPLEEFVIPASLYARAVYASIVGLPIAFAMGHLVVFEFPATTIGSLVISGVPYASPEGLAAAAVVVGLLLTGGLGSRAARLAGAGAALMVTVYTLPFEVVWPLVMAALGAATVVSVALVRRVTVVPLGLPVRPTLDDLGERVPFLAAAFGLGAMAAEALWWASPADFMLAVAGQRPLVGTPFVDELTVALVALAVTLLAAGWTWGSLPARMIGAVGAALSIAWLLPFEVRPAFAVAGWAALAAAGFAVVHRFPMTRLGIGAPSVGLLAFGGLVALSVVAPLSRLVVDATTVVDGLPVLTDATVALGSLALACAVGARLNRAEPLSRAGAIAAALFALYGLSVGLVDAFQRQVGSRPLEDLQREAQLGLSLLWSVLGGIAFAVGIRTRQPAVRRSGLALLGLATVKVFIVDLAALDVAYRVMSLVGLGVLLLLSAFVYARQQSREARSKTEA
jgi:uncharacterized membrane protein